MSHTITVIVEGIVQNDACIDAEGNLSQLSGIEP